MVHFYCNVFSHMPAGKLREVALASPDPAGLSFLLFTPRSFQQSM